MDSCPKCGANTEYWQEEARRFAANADYWRERAEKAEAEVVRLREAVRLRDRSRHIRSEWGDMECAYCGQSVCRPVCPTITHPVEVQP